MYLYKKFLNNKNWKTVFLVEDITSFVVLRIKVKKQKTLALIEDLHVATNCSHIFPQCDKQSVLKISTISIET